MSKNAKGTWVGKSIQPQYQTYQTAGMLKPKVTAPMATPPVVNPVVQPPVVPVASQPMPGTESAPSPARQQLVNALMTKNLNYMEP